MSTAPSRSFDRNIDYPTGDGKPVAETPVHRDNLLHTIWSLEHWYIDEPDTYVSGNMLMYYIEGQPRKHVSPDVFVVLGVPQRERDCYKTWEEPKPTLDFVAEITSKSTKKEDLQDKFRLYRDLLRVREYLLFDPYQEYLDPPQQLFRLTKGNYERILPRDGRLRSSVLGLHFERDGKWLRLYDPTARRWLPTPRDITALCDRAVAEYEKTARRLARSEAEVQRLRKELEAARAEPRKKRRR
jgi:Uma2 family endonuclease